MAGRSAVNPRYTFTAVNLHDTFAYPQAPIGGCGTGTFPNEGPAAIFQNLGGTAMQIWAAPVIQLTTEPIEGVTSSQSTAAQLEEGTGGRFEVPAFKALLFLSVDFTDFSYSGGPLLVTMGGVALTVDVPAPGYASAVIAALAAGGPVPVGDVALDPSVALPVIL